MWTSKLFWKLFLVYSGLCLVLAIGFLWIVSTWQRPFVVERLGDTMQLLAKEVGSRGSLEAITPEIERLNRTGPYQAVLFRPDGTVVAGNDEMELRYDEELPTALHHATSRRLLSMSGQSLLSVTTRIDQNQTHIGAIRLVRDLSDLDRSLATINRGVWLFAACIASIAVILTYLIIGRIVRPLAELTQGAQAIAADEEQHLVEFASRDELGLLGDAFNQMQRKLARRVGELKENTERLETVLGSMVEGVISVGADETILLANEASRQLLGMTVVEPVGRPLLTVTRSLPVHHAVTEALQTSQPVEKEFESAGPVRRVLALRATRLRGEPSPGVMVVLHDVSELRRLENLRREFVANVSHELKTPLASIKAYAETLKLGALNDPEHSLVFVGRIEEQAERLHQLILDLIHIARVESGQQAFEIVDLDLADAVSECIAQYTNTATIKNIQLSASPPVEPVVVRADDEGVHTILSNLIDNAIKYTPADGEVNVRWYAENGEGVVEVIDSGIGIPAKEQTRIFERFYRVDKARSRELGGTGLGLSIVKQLVRAFGGSVSVDSRPQGGSTFKIKIPLGA